MRAVGIATRDEFLSGEREIITGTSPCLIGGSTRDSIAEYSLVFRRQRHENEPANAVIAFTRCKLAVV